MSRSQIVTTCLPLFILRDFLYLFFLFTFQSAFDFGDFWSRRKILWDNTTRYQGTTHRLVVGNMLCRYLGFSLHSLLSRIVYRDLCREIFGFEKDGRHEVCDGLTSGFPSDFHICRISSSKKCRISLTTNKREILIATGLFIDNTGEFFF